SRRETHTFDDVVFMLDTIRAWAEREAKAATIRNAEEAAKRAISDICRQAGLDSDRFLSASWDLHGALTDLIAADRRGNAGAVAGGGKERWIGSLRGAAADIYGGALEVRVDDPEFRRQALKERRYTILRDQPREVLVEWRDRINLLSKSGG